MKTTLLALVLPMFCIGALAQGVVYEEGMSSKHHSSNKLINEALQRGRQPNCFYEIRNEKGKTITVEKMQNEVLKEGFIVGPYTTKQVSRFGDVSSSIVTMDFLPEDEFISYVYYNMNPDWSITLEQLNKKGSAYCYVQKTNFRKYYNIYWNGELDNGMLNGSGVGFISDNKDFIFFKGTFDKGVPIGETSFKWYASNGRMKPFDNSQVHTEKCNVGKFYDNLATIKIDGNYGFITRDANLAIAPSYNSIVSNFSNGQATVNNGKEEIIIDRTGKQIGLSARQIEINAREEAKRKQEEEIRKEEERQKELARQKEEAERRRLAKLAEEHRVEKFKNCKPGDRVYYSQDYVHKEMFFIELSRTYYTMRVVCFVEQNIDNGERIQIRVGSVESSNRDHYKTPVIDGIEYNKGDVLWIKPLNNSGWQIE